MLERAKQLPAGAPPAGETGTPLTRQESREIVTPYAFEVCPSLLGVPTASPTRRGVAMAIDGIIIAGLAKASLLFVLPVMVYLMWFRLKAQRYAHVVILLLLTAILASTATIAPDLLVEQDQDAQVAGAELSAEQAIGLAAAAGRLQQEKCQLDCMSKEFRKVARNLKQARVPKDKAVEILDGLASGSDYPAEQWPLLRDSLLKDFPLEAPALPVAKPVPSAEQPAAQSAAQSAEPWYMPDEQTHSVIEWVKGILSDVGIGFGWAAFYFTATVGWCHGQSIGKRLTGIQIIQLDGKELNLLAAFARQGGYGAGIATGLVGFVQIFWDPNRQAIQDKVSSTVVIRLGQPKRPLTH